MEAIVKDLWVQLGAVGLLLGVAGMYVWDLRQENRELRKECRERFEKVTQALIESAQSTKALVSQDARRDQKLTELLAMVRNRDV